MPNALPLHQLINTHRRLPTSSSILIPLSSPRSLSPQNKPQKVSVRASARGLGLGCFIDAVAWAWSAMAAATPPQSPQQQQPPSSPFVEYIRAPGGLDKVVLRGARNCSVEVPDSNPSPSTSPSARGENRAWSVGWGAGAGARFVRICAIVQIRRELGWSACLLCEFCGVYGVRVCDFVWLCARLDWSISGALHGSRGIERVELCFVLGSVV